MRIDGCMSDARGPPAVDLLLLFAGIVYNISGGKDLTLMEVNRVSEVVTSLADPSCNIIFGAVVDDQYEGEIHVTIIATGFSQNYEAQLFSPAKKAVEAAVSKVGGCALSCLSVCF